MPRTSRSSAGEHRVRRLVSDSAFAVSRTFSPSMPLARKASVGLPTSSKPLDQRREGLGQARLAVAPRAQACD